MPKKEEEEYGSLEERLKKQELGEFPDEWKPKEGDSLVGEVMSIRTPLTKVGERKVVEIKDKKGVRYSVWMRKVLESEFERQEIGVGDKVGIKFLGKPKGKRYFAYAVVKG